MVMYDVKLNLNQYRFDEELKLNFEMLMIAMLLVLKMSHRCTLGFAALCLLVVAGFVNYLLISLAHLRKMREVYEAIQNVL